MERSNSAGRNVLAVLLIMVGGLGVAKQVFHIQLWDAYEFWPIFVLVPGLVFEVSAFISKRGSGLLVPAGILITLGCLFYFETSTNWIYSGYTWPVYILAPAVGLFQLFLFGDHNKGLLIPVGVLTAVAGISFYTLTVGNFFEFIERSLVWPIALIIVGIIILFSKSSKN